MNNFEKTYLNIVNEENEKELIKKNNENKTCLVCTEIQSESSTYDNSNTETMTNGDRIRAMSDEELAEKFVYSIVWDEADEGWYSTLFPDTIEFGSKQKALDATIKELKKITKK